MSEEESRELALFVTRHIRQLSGPLLARYCRDTYQLEHVEHLTTDVVFAVEVVGGNWARLELSSCPVRQWELHGQECSLIRFIDMRPCNAASDRGHLWPYPILSYYAEFPLVLAKEMIGIIPCSKRGERPLIYSRLLRVSKAGNSFDLVAEEDNWLFGTPRKKPAPGGDSKP